MNPNNRWVKKAAMIPWDTIEAEYAILFPSHTGMPAKPLRMALGSLLIQKQYHYPDEELVEQIRENPYYQYFIGLPGYEDKIPFVPSLLVEFRKTLLTAAISVSGFPERNSGGQRKKQTARQRKRSSIRIIPTE